MPTREEKIAFLQSKMAQGAEAHSAQSGPSREEKIAFIQSKMNGGMSPDSQKPGDQPQSFMDTLKSNVMSQIEPYKKAAEMGAEGLKTAVPLAGKVIDYFDAPIRQAANAPANIIKGKRTVPESLGDVLGQLVSSPSSAPTWRDVLKNSGVSDQSKKVSSMMLARPGFDSNADFSADDASGNLRDMASPAQVGGLTAEAALSGAGVRAIGKLPGLAGKALSSANKSIIGKVGEGLEFTPSAAQQKVLDAAKNLGIEVPKAVLTDNKAFQEFESMLSQSGTLPAREIRKKYDAFFGGLKKASGSIEDMKTADSDFSLGSQIRDTLSKNIDERKAPVSEMYSKIQPDLRKIPVSEDVATKAFAALKRNPLFQSKDGLAAIQEAKQAAIAQGDLNSLKEWRSTILDSVGPTASPLEQKRASAIYDAVSSIRNNSINAMKSELPKSMHKEVDGLIDQLSLADQAHASNVSDVNKVRGIVGGKEVSSPSALQGKLADAKELDLTQKAANLDPASMAELQKNFPAVFEKAKTAKINDLIQRSTSGNGEFNENTFLKLYGNLEPEVKDMIFSPQIQSKIEDIKTIKGAIPDQLGPSGTPKGMWTGDWWNLKKSAGDYAIKKSLDSVSGAATGASGSTSLPKAIDVPNRAAPLIQSVPQYLETKPAPPSLRIVPKAADSKDAPKKGEAKWAKDGAEKLKEHLSSSDQPIDPSVIDSLSETKKGKNLLIQASDLKPGSASMEKLIKKISQMNGEGEQ